MWLVDRIVLPLAAAAWMLHARWGRPNVAYALAVLFLLFVRMYLSYRERPDFPPLERYRPFRSALEWWHACDVLGLFVLLGSVLTVADAFYASWLA